MSKYVFRCDASLVNGYGHLARCLNIAREVIAQRPSSEVAFYGEFNEFAQSLIESFNFITNDNNALEDSILIVDHYELDEIEVKNYKKFAKKLIKIDDFNNTNLSDFDMIINFRIGAECFLYKSDKTCLGISYFPVKKELIDIRKTNLNKQKKKVENVLILIGANDIHKVSKKLISLLDEVVANMKIRLISNDTSQNIENLKNNELELLPFSSSIENYYSRADFVITGGGLSKYEAGFCLIPNAALSQNRGQYEDTSILENESLTTNLGLASDVDKNWNEIKKKLVTAFSFEERKKSKRQMELKYITNSSTNLALKILEL